MIGTPIWLGQPSSVAKRVLERMDAFLKSVESTPPPLAVLRIPKLGLEVPVLEGTDDVTLDRGVGHIEGHVLQVEELLAIAGR